MLPLLQAVNIARGRSHEDVHEADNEFSKKVTYGLLAGVAGLGAFLLIRKAVRHMNKRAQFRNALTPGDPAAYAIQLKMAFDNDRMFGWGTNEDLVFSVLESIPDSRSMRKVRNAYWDTYTSELMADLQDELDTEEFAQALSIINSKP